MLFCPDSPSCVLEQGLEPDPFAEDLLPIYQAEGPTAEIALSFAGSETRLAWSDFPTERAGSQSPDLFRAIPACPHDENEDQTFMQTTAELDPQNLSPFPADELASQMHQFIPMSTDDAPLPAATMLRKHNTEASLRSHDRASERHAEVMHRAEAMLLTLMHNMHNDPALLSAGAGNAVSFPHDIGLSSYANIVQWGNFRLDCNDVDVPSDPQITAVSAFRTSVLCTQGSRENFRKEEQPRAQKQRKVYSLRAYLLILDSKISNFFWRIYLTQVFAMNH